MYKVFKVENIPCLIYWRLKMAPNSLKFPDLVKYATVSGHKNSAVHRGQNF